MSRTGFEQAYIERTERERKERFAKARAEGCPPGWEEEWERSGKFRMMINDRKAR
jgi:hypothetical protein